MTNYYETNDALKADVYSILEDYIKVRLAVGSIAGGAGHVQQRMFPSEPDLLALQAQKLDIIQRKRDLGMPMTDEEYDYMVNEEKPFLNPGRAVTIGLSFLKNPTKPALNLGAFGRYFGKGAAHESGAISRFFGL